MPTTPPYSYVDYGLTGDLTSAQIGGTFNGVPLEVINTSDVFVVRTTSAGVKTTLTSGQFTVTESGSNINVVISTLSPAISASDLIRIGRSTEIGETTRSFTDGSVLKASDLNEQNKQLLFSVQETADGGVGSLPLDTDNKFDANGKVIKNLATGNNGDDAVSKSYVDGIQLFGTGAALPQTWDFTTSSGDIVGSNRNYTLASPTPAATTGELYIIEVGGVVQTPNTYAITEVSDVYTLSLLNGASIPDSTAVHVRNFGVSRNVLEQPLVTNEASSPTFTIKKLTSQTANLQEWVDDASTPNVLASVAVDGDASFSQISANAGLNITGLIQSRPTSGDSFTTLGTIHQIVRADADTVDQRQIERNFSGTSMTATPGSYSVPFQDEDSTDVLSQTRHSGLTLTITPKSDTSNIILIGKFKTGTNSRQDTAFDNERIFVRSLIFKDVTSTVQWGQLISGTEIPGSNSQTNSFRTTIDGENTERNEIVGMCNIFSVIPPDQHTKDTPLTLHLGLNSNIRDDKFFLLRLFADRSNGFEWVAIEIG